MHQIRRNGVVEDWDPGTIVQSDIFVYTNRGTSQECKLRILGIAEAGTTVLDDTGSYYIKGDKLKVANLGSSSLDERLSSWLYNVKKLIQVDSVTLVVLITRSVVCNNPHGLLVSDQVTVYGANPVVYNGTFTVTSRIDDFTFSYQINVPTDIIPQGNILLSVDLNRGKSNVTSINKVVSNSPLTFKTPSLMIATFTLLLLVYPTIRLVAFTGSALILVTSVNCSDSLELSKLFQKDKISVLTLRLVVGLTVYLSGHISHEFSIWSSH